MDFYRDFEGWLKSLSHDASEELPNSLAALVLLQTASASDIGDRALYALKRFSDSHFNSLAKLLATKSASSSKLKRWHYSWIQDVVDSKPNDVNSASSSPTIIIGTEGFCYSPELSDFNLDVFTRIVVDAEANRSHIYQRLVEEISQTTHSMTNSGIWLISARLVMESPGFWDMLSIMFGSQIVLVDDSGDFINSNSQELHCRPILWNLPENTVRSLTLGSEERDLLAISKLSDVLSVAFGNLYYRILNHGLSCFDQGNDFLQSLIGYRQTLDLTESILNSFDIRSEFTDALSTYSNLSMIAKSMLISGQYRTCVSLIRAIPKKFWSRYHHKWLINSLFELGLFDSVIIEGDNYSGNSKDVIFWINESRSIIEMFDRLSEMSESAEVIPVVTRDRPFVVSVLHAAPPFQSGGYVNRAHGLLQSLSANGWRVHGLVRPGYPDTSSTQGFLGSVEAGAYGFDGVIYELLPSIVSRANGEYAYMLESISEYHRAFTKLNPDVIHLRSTYVSALPALIAARMLGIRTIYEVSGMWELVYEGKRTARFEGMRIRTTILETLVCERASKVVAATEAMGAIIKGRSSFIDSIDLVPNAVDSDKFVPCVKDSVLLEELGWDSNTPIIGYLGSFVDYEGLDVLVRSIAILVANDIDCRLLLVGDGAKTREIKRLISHLNLESYVYLTGRVGHSEVPRYYSLVDICPFPRLSTPATRAVSPLKPFEALSSAKQVIVSDVPALVEIVDGGRLGKIFESGSPAELALRIRETIESGLEDNLIARKWIQDNRTWGEVGSNFSNMIHETIN